MKTLLILAAILGAPLALAGWLDYTYEQGYKTAKAECRMAPATCR